MSLIKYDNLITDIVCSNFFGVNVNSLQNKNHPLVNAIKKAFGDSFSQPKFIIFCLLFPSIGEWLMKRDLMNPLDHSSIEYIRQVSYQVINERRSKKVVS